MENTIATGATPPSTVRPPGLVTGERVTVEEFMRRWEELPDLKNAELIDGVVHVLSPAGLEHGSLSSRTISWLGYYAYATPGCDAGSHSTWLMSGSVPQPDVYLRILPSHGGQSRNEGEYGTDAPELVAEVCDTSTEVDFGPKLALYERAGVREYVTVELLGQRLIWRVLENGAYVALTLPPDGIIQITGLSRAVARRAGLLGRRWREDAGGIERGPCFRGSPEVRAAACGGTIDRKSAAKGSRADQGVRPTQKNQPGQYCIDKLRNSLAYFFLPWAATASMAAFTLSGSPR